MINNSRKTIGVFINRSDGSFERLIHKCIQKRATELNYDTLFFCTVGTRESGNAYDVLERSIFSFAPVEHLDGIITAPNSYELLDSREILFDMLRERVKCPVVFVRANYSDFCSVSTDEKHAIRPLITHLIEDHGMKKIGFMAGFPGHADSEVRLACYRDELTKHGLEYGPRSVFYGDMWKNKGEEAFHHFFDNDDDRPEAIVCANDYMACALIDAVHAHGYKVPDDIVITGFDNIAISEYFEPSITTVVQDYETMITASVDLLDRRIREQEQGIFEKPVFFPIAGRLIKRESCGCKEDKSMTDREFIVSQNKRIQDIQLREISQTYFSALLNSCNTLEDIHNTIVRKLGDVPHLASFYLCLFKPENENDVMADNVTDEARLVMAIQNRKDMGMPMIDFERKIILPPLGDMDDTPQSYYMMLLHKQNSTFGYSVLQYDPGHEPTMFFHHWNVIIANALSNFSYQHKLQTLYEERRLSSITDLLTGLYNRRGLEERLSPMWKTLTEERHAISFVSYDLNNLKYINDTFGHLEGDFALCAVSDAIRQATPMAGISARMGGDEFLTALPMYTEEEALRFLDSYRHILDRINETSGKGYKISASYGVYYVTLDTKTTIDDCLRQSDAKMYEAKSKLKRRRDDRPV